MTFLSSLLAPISITFIVIIVGYYLGRIKFANISLDLAGVLIVAVFAGMFLAIITPCKVAFDINEYQSYMKFFSAFGTALFVSSIGIATGSILDFRKRKEIKAILVGSLMVASAFATMRIIFLADKNIAISKLLGSLCGALTTTPGLSAACELKNVIPEEVILGYGCTYLFGVVATVLFAQITTRKSNFICKNDYSKTYGCENKPALNGLIQIGFAVIFGRVIGSIEIFGFSLGDSGGMLCSGIVIGLLVKKALPNKLLTNKKLTIFRSMGLSLFFVGNGIPAGVQIYSGFDIKVVLYGAIMTLIPIFFGLFLHKLFLNETPPAITIAGGMTSTPAIGVLTEKHRNISLSEYALAYFGALVTIVILIRTNIIGAF